MDIASLLLIVITMMNLFTFIASNVCAFIIYTNSEMTNLKLKHLKNQNKKINDKFIYKLID